MDDITQILNLIEQGDPSQADLLLPLVYNELRKLASSRMAQESADQTLQATALVHEAYVRLVGSGEGTSWNSRGHFFGAAAEAMRRILVEQARRKGSWKAGGRMSRIELDEDLEVSGSQLDMVVLDEALGRLEAVDPRAASLVKLRFFAGLTVKQAAETLHVSVGTAENDWAYAKSWLCLQLS